VPLQATCAEAKWKIQWKAKFPLKRMRMRGQNVEEVEKFAEISARVTHNHPEGIKGAKAVAAAIFLGRAGKSKEEILDYVERTYGYAISEMTCDSVRPRVFNRKLSIA